MDGVDICAVIGCRAGGGDGVVLDDLLLGYRSGTSCRTAFWTEVTLRLFLHGGDGTVLVCQ